MKLTRRTCALPLLSFSLLLLVLLRWGAAPALGWSHVVVDPDDIIWLPEVRFPPPHRIPMRCEDRKPTDYPLGIYLGPSRLTASHYNKDDQAVATVASVPASPAWRSFSEDVLRDREPWGPDCEYNETCNNAVAKLFADAMTAILDAATTALGRDPSDPPYIGNVVLPRKTHDRYQFLGLFDTVLHDDFPCYQWARRGCFIEYDIIRVNEAAHHAYHKQIPWGNSWDDPTEEDSFSLLVNLEPGFLELAGVCPLQICSTDGLRAHAWPELGEDALWPDGNENRTSDDRASPSARFGEAVRLLADTVAAYVPFDLDRNPNFFRDFRGVIVAGAASEQAMAALRVALHEALPYLNETQFFDTVDPASVFSLGAAVQGRNTQLIDERGDCDCMVSEESRRQQGYPLNSEFPCNRRFARLESMHY